MALGGFPLPQLFRQRVRISWIPQSDHADRLPPCGHGKTFSRGLDIEPRHWVRRETQGRRLQGQIRSGLAQIVERVPVGFPVLFKLSMREGQDQDGRLACPGAVKFYQHAGQGLEIFRVLLR